MNDDGGGATGGRCDDTSCGSSDTGSIKLWMKY